MDILFGLTRIRDKFCQLGLQLPNRFLLSTTHGKSKLLCDYSSIMRRYCNLHHGAMVRWHQSKGIEGRIFAAVGVGFEK
jgi:hypothetical protein